MNIEKKLKSAASSAIHSIYNYDVKNEDIQIQSTSNEYEGYFTILLFSFSIDFLETPTNEGLKSLSLIKNPF